MTPPTTPALPPLPAPVAFIVQNDYSDDRLSWERVPLPINLNIPLFTKYQVEELLAAALSAARSEKVAAKREREAEFWNLLHEYREGRDDERLDWIERRFAELLQLTKEQGNGN
jgi:hypothetical protein